MRTITLAMLITLLQIANLGCAARSHVEGSESTITREVERTGAASKWKTTSIITITPKEGHP